MSHRITLIPGDGIGPEVTEAVLRILKFAGVEIEWDRHDAGLRAFARYNTSLPRELLDSVVRHRVALKGPVTTPIAEGFQSVNVGLRKALDLYANVRPVKNLPGVTSRYEDVNLVIIRENTEDLYSGLEHEVVPGVVESLKIITARASDKIANFAFRYARDTFRAQSRNRPSLSFMMLALWTDVTFRRPCSRAYSKANRAARVDARSVMILRLSTTPGTTSCSRPA
jgi:isocitrate dehydrogenase (NAD+)